jgi:hypothetical protein
MKISAFLLGLLAYVCGPAGGADQPVLTCNTKAINAAERPRYIDLVRSLRRSITNSRQIPDGYVLQLDEHSIPLPDLAEWIRLERRCCPFLTFRLEIIPGSSQVQLTLRGPGQAKEIIAAEIVAK